MPILSNELISLIFTALTILSIIFFGAIGFAPGADDDDKDKDKDKDKDTDTDDDDDDDDQDKDKDKKKFDAGYVKELRDEAKKYRLELKKIKDEKEKAEEERLKDEGKFKDLAEKAEAKNKELLENYKKKAINMELMIEGRKANIIEDELAVLANKEKIEVDDDFNVTGAAEAIEALKESKPKYFQKEDTDDSDSDDKEPEDNPKPGLKKKIFESGEKSSRQSIADGLRKLGKKGKKTK